jgi:hypothetical protein
LAERHFAQLEGALLRGGVAVRHVRRVVAELEDHWSTLVDDALRRGSSERDAHAEARRMMGTDAVLLDRYAARTELRAWSCRRPAIWFTLMPLACYLAVSLATMTFMLLSVQLMSGLLRTAVIPVAISHLIEGSVHVVFLWAYPSLIAAGFAVLAHRRCIAPAWPMIGIVILSIVVSMINVDFILTGGSNTGSAGAGIGLSTRNLLQPITRSVAIALMALALTRLGARRFAHSSVFD